MNRWEFRGSKRWAVDPAHVHGVDGPVQKALLEKHWGGSNMGTWWIEEGSKVMQVTILKKLSTSFPLGKTSTSNLVRCRHQKLRCSLGGSRSLIELDLPDTELPTKGPSRNHGAHPLSGLGLGTYQSLPVAPKAPYEFGSPAHPARQHRPKSI